MRVQSGGLEAGCGHRRVEKSCSAKAYGAFQALATTNTAEAQKDPKPGAAMGVDGEGRGGSSGNYGFPESRAKETTETQSPTDGTEENLRIRHREPKGIV